MVEIILDPYFKEKFLKIKDTVIKERIKKQVEKIKQDPEIGKPMRYSRKGTREVYISSYRLSYSYYKEKNLVYMLDFYHKDEQ